MRALPICILLVGFLLSGCANHPKHVSAEEFQRFYRSVNTQTLVWYSYIGETNGAVYMARSRVGLLGGKPRDKVYLTETNGLPTEFLQALTRNTIAERSRAATGSQPLRFGTNEASGAAGSRR